MNKKIFDPKEVTHEQTDNFIKQLIKDTAPHIEVGGKPFDLIFTEAEARRAHQHWLDTLDEVGWGWEGNFLDQGVVLNIIRYWQKQ